MWHNQQRRCCFPMAALKSVLQTSIISAKEGRDVAVINIPNTFIQTHLENEEDKAIMYMHGKLAELLVKVAPEIYMKYVTVNAKGETVVYMYLLNILYDYQGSSVVLQVLCEGLEVNRLCFKPLQPLCG